MKTLDWILLLGTQAFILIYGWWKSRKKSEGKDYFDGGGLSWFTVGISVMATQASAITFLSAPGKAFDDGLRFIQYYFGLPLAIIVVSAVAITIYKQKKARTAYEILEDRYNIYVRLVTAALFLIQRGLAAGFTIFAPALVLSAILGWDISLTVVFTGVIVLVYTLTGGARAVAETQKTQMFIIIMGMLVATILMIQKLPISFSETLYIAGASGKLNAIDTQFSLKGEYNIWSGLIGGFFLSLSYFGTDQSQVSRYLTGSSVTQSRLGMIFNGFFKIPMQFGILLIGVILYVFYLFYPAPLSFNTSLETVLKDEQRIALQVESEQLRKNHEQLAIQYLDAVKSNDEALKSSLGSELQAAQSENVAFRKKVKEEINKVDKSKDTNDTNYIFFYFVYEVLPMGMLGLIVSVVISASMSSTSSELNALATTTTFDFYKRLKKRDMSDDELVKFSKWSTFAWGVYATIFALFANRLGTLIEAVNYLGSIFYGTILGIFLCAFFLKNTKSWGVLAAAAITQVFIIVLDQYSNDVHFLWFNVIGGLMVPILASVISLFLKQETIKLSEK